MKINTVQVVDSEASARLRHEARRARRERTNYLVTRSLVTLLQTDISEIRAHTDRVQYYGSGGSPLPPVASHLVGKYEEMDDIALLGFAREKGRPVLVEFSGEPSKRGENRLRQAAKSRNFTLQFFRLDGRWAIIEVHPPLDPTEFDANFLKSLGVR